MGSIIKGSILFSSIVVFMPLIFFILVGLFGRMFVFTVDRTSWLARTKVRWIRAIADKFLV